MKQPPTEQAGCFRLVYSPPGRYVNDHCFIEDAGGTLHLFHIVGPVGKRCYDEGAEVSFGHATSNNLESWTAQADVLAVDGKSEHERDHIFAPFAHPVGDDFSMLYAGVNQKMKKEFMCLARSKDLFHWRKDPRNPVFRPSSRWAEDGGTQDLWSCCRDPHLLEHPRYGYILYFVAWVKETNGKRVAIGAATSNDLVSWKDVGPVLVRDAAFGHSTVSMESPCVIERQGRYFLFYKHRDETRLVISDDPLNFNDRQDTWFSIAHAAEIFPFRGNWFISSCSREPSDIRHEQSDRTKGLFLASLEWSQDTPEIKSIL